MLIINVVYSKEYNRGTVDIYTEHMKHKWEFISPIHNRNGKHSYVNLIPFIYLLGSIVVMMLMIQYQSIKNNFKLEM